MVLLRRRQPEWLSEYSSQVGSDVRTGIDTRQPLQWKCLHCTEDIPRSTDEYVRPFVGTCGRLRANLPAIDAATANVISGQTYVEPLTQ